MKNIKLNLALVLLFFAFSADFLAQDVQDDKSVATSVEIETYTNEYDLNLLSPNDHSVLPKGFVDSWNDYFIQNMERVTKTCSHFACDSLSVLRYKENNSFFLVGDEILSYDKIYHLKSANIIGTDSSVLSQVLCVSFDSVYDEILCVIEDPSIYSVSNSILFAKSSNQNKPEYSGGRGTSRKPFLISNMDDLIALSQYPSHWGKDFKQTADIVFPEDPSLVDWNSDGVINSQDAAGFIPIGNASYQFTGSYEGQNYKVSNLFIESDAQYLGLFGYAKSANFSNIVMSNVLINSSSQYVGGLLGYSCYQVEITECYVDGNILGAYYVGGLVGHINGSTDVTKSAANCEVSGIMYVGGLVGYANGYSASIDNCYSLGSTYCTLLYCGGLVGYSNGAEIDRVYSASHVFGWLYDGGIIGYDNNSDVSLSYWAHEESGLDYSSGSHGISPLSNDQMRNIDNFFNWDFNSIWKIDSTINNGFPYLFIFEDHIRPQVTEFIGDGLWSDEDLWTNGIPDGDDNTTVIVSGNCELDTEASVVNLIVEAGAVLTVNDNSQLEVSDELIVVSDSEGHGELVFENEQFQDSIVQEKYFKPGEWNFVCAPTDLKAKDILPDLRFCTDISDETAEFWVMSYSEQSRANTKTGMLMIYDEDYVFKAGSGFMVWVDEEAVASYRYSAPTVSDVQNVDAFYTNSVFTSSDHSGWNLMGNPFSFALEYDMVFGWENNKEEFEGAVFVWSGDAYRVWVNGTGDQEAKVIDPLEAFFVKRKDETDGIFCVARTGFENVVSKSASIKSTSVDENSVLSTLTIEINSGDNYDRTFVRVSDSFVQDFEPIQDARKFSTSTVSSPVIYTEDDLGMLYSVNSVPSGVENQMPVKIGVPSNASLVDLSFKVDGNFAYKLLDTQEGKLIDIEDGMVLTYDVTEVSLKDRFTLFVSSEVDDTPTDINVPSNTDVISNVLVRSSTESIQLISMSSELISFDIIDMKGQVVKSDVLNGLSTLDINIKSGVYIVNLYGDTSQSNLKVVVP